MQLLGNVDALQKEVLLASERLGEHAPVEVSTLAQEGVAPVHIAAGRRLEILPTLEPAASAMDTATKQAIADLQKLYEVPGRLLFCGLLLF